MQIWNITHTLALREELEQEGTKRMTINSSARFFYWHVERRKKRGAGWIFVRDFHGTKRRAAFLFCKFFRDGNHRLRVMHKF